MKNRYVLVVLVFSFFLLSTAAGEQLYSLGDRTSIQTTTSDTIENRLNQSEYNYSYYSNGTVKDKNWTGWHYEKGGNTYYFDVGGLWRTVSSRYSDGSPKDLEVTVELQPNNLTKLLQAETPYKDCKNDGKDPDLDDCFNEEYYFEGGNITKEEASNLSDELDNIPIYKDGVLEKTTSLTTNSKNITAKVKLRDSTGDKVVIRVGNQSTNFKVQTVNDWGQGSFNGTTEDKPDSLGNLSIGYRNGTSSDNLTAFWRMDRETYDGKVIDYSGNSNDGSTTNFDNDERGKQGVFNTTSFDFDGGNDRVEVSSFSMDNTNGGLSFGGWIKPDFDTLSSSGVVMRFRPSGSHNTGIDIGGKYHGSTGDLNFEWSDGGMQYAIQRNWQDEWVHVFMVADDQNPVNLDIYVNGSNVKSGGVSGSQTVNDQGKLTLGADNSGGYEFDGKIDEFQYYNRSLSATEVKKLYKYGTPYHGEFNSSKIDTSSSTSWDKLEVDAHLPADTSLSATFQALDSNGNLVDSDLISIDTNGTKNYSISVSNSEDARVHFNGTTSNVTKTWETQSFTVYNSSTTTLDITGPDNDTVLVRGSWDHVDIDVTNTSDISSWSVNNTAKFEISDKGVLDNHELLKQPEVYPLKITVTDVNGTTDSHVFTLTVEEDKNTSYLILSLGFVAALLIWTGFKIGEQHSWMKIFFISVGQLFMIGTVFTGYMLSLDNYSSVSSYLIYFVLAGIMVFVVYMFYIILLYIKSAALVTSGTNDEFGNDFKVGDDEVENN